MKKLIYPVFFLGLIILSACQRDLPEPETKIIAVENHSEVIPASGMWTAENDSLIVKHQVKGNDVYIECIAKGASFRNNEAKLILSIDGKKTKEINNAAFVIKGLNAGTHHIKLALIKHNVNIAAAEKEIQIVIP